MKEGIDFIFVWHGTSRANWNGILKRGFKRGTWFAKTEAEARKYGLLKVKSEKSLVVARVAVLLKDLYSNGYYCANNSLHLNGGFYSHERIQF